MGMTRKTRAEIRERVDAMRQEFVSRRDMDWWALTPWPLIEQLLDEHEELRVAVESLNVTPDMDWPKKLRKATR